MGTDHVQRVSDTDGAILLGFENEQAMTTAHAGCPSRWAIPVAEGHLMDHAEHCTGWAGFPAIATSSAAPALMPAVTSGDDRRTVKAD